jgi:hypothetical protein
MRLTISDEKYLKALAYFCKRITYDDAYRRSHGETEAERKDMAYTILNVMSDISDILADGGYSVR